MTSVVLQQVTSKFARRNAGRTLDKPIALKYLQRHLSPEEFQEIEYICTEGKVYVWGSKSERVHQYEKMPPRQTLVLFRRSSTVYKCGVIFEWVFNPGLAEYLWGFDNYDETWSLVFFLKGLIDLSVPAWEINKLIDRKPADNWQGLTAVTSPKADKVIEFVTLKLKERSNKSLYPGAPSSSAPSS
ncbi:MAG: hypothetical protein ACR2KU_12825 [Gammaproteobacteria bacterium]